MNADQVLLFEKVIRAARDLGKAELREVYYHSTDTIARSNAREHLEKLVRQFHLSFTEVQT